MAARWRCDGYTWRRISSAIEKASYNGMPSGTISNNLSLETVTKMSTDSWRVSMASRAWDMRREVLATTLDRLTES